VSYVYLLAMSLVFLLSFHLHEYHKTNTRKIKVLQATKRRIAFQRSQLNVLMNQRSLAKQPMRMPTKVADNNVALEIWETEKAVANIDKRIHALTRPWHEAQSSGSCSSLFRLLLTQRLTRPMARWISCLGMPQSQQYCHLLSATVEKTLVTFMTISYVVVTGCVYFFSYVKNNSAAVGSQLFREREKSEESSAGPDQLDQEHQYTNWAIK